MRIEFFGDEIESIHYFDIAKQLSTNELKKVSFEPANDVLFTDQEIETFKSKIARIIERETDSEKQNLIKQSTMLDIERIESRFYHSQFYKYTKYIKQETNSLIDYFKPDLVFVSNKDQVDTTIEFIKKEAKDYFDSLYLLGKQVK